MYACSALCATGFYSCCDEKCEQVSSQKICNHHGQKEEDDDNCDDCQKDHLAFFGTISQYHFIKTIDIKIFQPLVAIVLSKEIIQPVISPDLAFVFTGFHPPPPKENIRTLIQSFLI